MLIVTGHGDLSLLCRAMSGEDGHEVNVDAQLMKNGSASLSRVDERLVRDAERMICCTLREDLLVEASTLAREGRSAQR
jgi:G3E family GTPase